MTAHWAGRLNYFHLTFSTCRDHHCTSPGKDQNSKGEVYFLLNVYFLLSELEKWMLPEEYGPDYCNYHDGYPHICVLISVVKGPKLGYEKL